MTIGFLWLAYNLIRFDDQYEVRLGAEILLADTVQEKGTDFNLPNQEIRTVPQKEPR